MKKRILSILLTLCMLFCLVPTGVFAEGETATGSAAIQLGTDALSKNVNTATAPTVYFGQDHENNPGAWRVIDYDGNSAAGIAGNMTLLAANNMGLSKFGASNAYADSALKEAIDALADKLTAKETDAVEKRTLASGNYDEENTDGVAGPAVSNAVFWPLSSKEANAVNNDLRVVDPEHPGWASSYWWLRSPDEDYSTAFVAGRGEVRYYGGYSTSKEFGVRPAFDLNLDSVLFASAAVGGKPDGGLQPVSPNYTGNEWKLTLYDSKRNDFSRTTWEVSASTKGGTVEISYTDAKTGANEYISALIFDDVGNVIYYGRSNASLTEKDGTAQLTIPAGFAEGTYTLKVFNEQYNGDRKTDLASGFADVTLTVEKRVDEQFTLAPGGRYYFDLSAMDIPGTVNSNLPDSTLHYVPFTYAGTVDAYSMENETDTAKQPYEHSLFIADYNVKCSLQRETLAEMNLIYGQTYTASNVNYTLRAPSVGDHHRNEGEGSGLAPIDNEWDTIYQKSADYIKNWYKMRSFGQDIGTGNVEGMYLSRGGHFAAQATFWARPTLPERDIGFRPVLEVLNPDTLGSDGLKVVTLDLGGGKLGGSSDAIHIIVKTGSTFTAPASDGMTPPDGNTGSYFMWLDGNGNSYAPGASVPADVTKLTAQWRDIAVPTGEIKIAENGWKSFFNTITFDLFFKDTQMVTVTAADNSGGAVTVEYLLSEKALTESELARMTFTAYSAPFSINADNEYVIYAKLTDTSGNVAYINTNGIVLDATVPVISGIEAGKTYCAAQTITVDEKYIGTVKVNDTEVSLDKNSQFALSPASGKQTIVVTDKAGNETRVTVTVNNGHTYEWQSENGQYWQKCKFCNHETAKKDIPTINISGADKVCRTQDYKFSFTLPEGATDAACGYEFIGLGGAPLTPTVENGLYSGIIKASTYPAEENSFKLIVSAKTADGFAFSAEKKVTLQNEHTGGTATCKNKAICEVCGESYGKLDPNNHANLKHIDAKAATKTSEGNIEYWYCDGCNKYYKDAKATQEITKAQTVTAKLPDDSKSPQTGDNSNLALWIALLFISGGAVTVTTVYGRKKKRLTK